MNKLYNLLALSAIAGITACGGSSSKKAEVAGPSNVPGSSSHSATISSISSSVASSLSSNIVSSIASSSSSSLAVAIGETPTYWDNVAPILGKNCTSCHTSGGIAPFALTTYAQAKTWAKAAAAAVASRVMPPWPMTGDGSCGEYQDSKWMSDADIKTIVDWAAGGTPAGVPRDDLIFNPPLQLVGGTKYKTPNIVPVIEGGPLSQFDEYRCFLVDPKLTKDQFVTGYEVVPGNKAMIHHALVYSVDPKGLSGTGVSNGERMKQLQALTPTREGWSCFGTAGDSIKSKGIPVSWAPGQGATYFPENTGFRLKAGDQLVVQMHYNLEDEKIRGQSDQTEISLLLKDSVPREGFFILEDPLLESLATGHPEVLPAGKSAYDYSWTLEMAESTKLSATGKLDLYGSLPHMHQRGKSFSAKVQHADGSSECTADIKAWDFHWQLYYFYQKPFTINATDAIKTTCTYDTSADTSPVQPGWGTHNEMCLYGMFLVPQ